MCVNEIQDNDIVRMKGRNRTTTGLECKDGIHVCERDTGQRQG